MANEHGEWIMYGVEEDDPLCLHDVDELIACVNEVGFLPLFKNEAPGFSVEERTGAGWWWSENEARDPWIWRGTASRSARVAYGKFFDRKAGFISLDWLPYFVNYRRNGYDFDARWDDGLASYREKHIMDLFEERETLFSSEMKQMAGFGKDGDKNFDGVLTELQMQSYLTVRDFRKRLNKKGQPYGWAVAVYCTPEALWGAERVTAAYAEDPEVSKERILAHLEKTFPGAKRQQLEKLIK